MKIQENTPPLLKAISEVSDPKLQKALLTILAYKNHLKKTKKGGEQNPIYKTISQFDGFFSRIIEHASTSYSPVLKHESEEHQQERKRLINAYSSLKKQELVEKLADSVIAAKQMATLAKRYKDDAEELANISLKKFIKDTQSITNRAAGRERKYKNNNDYLDHCLEVLKEKKGRALRSSDFIAYMNLVIQKAPPFRTKTGESAEDKKLNDVDRNIHINAKNERKEKVFNGWVEGTIRKRWEEKTGLKATLKKVSPLK